MTRNCEQNKTNERQILFHSIKREYILTNLPWLIGSLGTMVEDVAIFVQFRIYAGDSSVVNAPVLE